MVTMVLLNEEETWAITSLTVPLVFLRARAGAVAAGAAAISFETGDSTGFSITTFPQLSVTQMTVHTTFVLPYAYLYVCAHLSECADRAQVTHDDDARHD